MDILNVIALIVCTMTGVVYGCLIGYRAGLHKTARKKNSISTIDIRPFLGAFTEAYCTQCGAPMMEMLDHYHGCPIAADFKLVTIAKPGG